ncbi:MAG: hypothetical protein KTR31_00330 [Myxococcales bacterium]|nr:hypothetical protein [Myxococcales bacterium]
MVPPVFDEAELPERLRRLIAMEVDRIVSDLAARRDFLLDTWSRHRDRGPFLDTIFARWRTLSMTDLGLVEAEAMAACEAFHRELEDFRLYMQFTQDMPATLAERYDLALEHISAYGALAIERLGGAPELPVFSFDDDGDEQGGLLQPPRLEVVEGFAGEE